MANNQPSLKYIFDRRNKASNKQAETLYFEVMHKRIRRYIHTGVKLCKHQWNVGSQTVVNHKDMDLLNTKLEAMRRHLLDLMIQHSQSPTGFDIEEYVQQASGEMQASKISFIDFALQRVGQRGLKYDTQRQHLVSIQALERSGVVRSFKDLTPANILRFDAWLREEQGLTHQNTIYGYHKRIKVYINEAVQFGYIRESPYTKVKIQRGEAKKLRYLTQAEVDALRGLDLGEDASLGRVRSLFVLQMYTGLSYADMYSVDWGQAERREDGRYYIRQSRIKTGEEYYLLLLPPAVEVLEGFEWKLPQLSNQKYNTYLKGLGIAAGITKPLTSHIARHTFATTITLAKRVPIEIVAKMLGHSDIKTTQRYARVLAEDVIDAFIDLEGKL